eukprot:5276521-Prorocentrum_lima.AAC.1
MCIRDSFGGSAYRVFGRSRVLPGLPPRELPTVVRPTPTGKPSGARAAEHGEPFSAPTSLSRRETRC